MRLAMAEEVMAAVAREADQDEEGVAVGSAGSDELDAKTQENPHPRHMCR